ncbi:MAG: RNA polymerase-associated protein RapA [Proteobacteria bacterium]|nr:RNA polymerase-associated protein RapA [Pseudomonadota bacterium]
MQEFSIGQRWISGAELHLGLGMVIEIEHRTVSIIFPATTETRIYARQNAPLSRVRFKPGDWIQNQQNELLKVVELEESNGLILYQCEDEAGQSVPLTEGKLSNFLQLNQPGERLLNGLIDKNKWFNLRTLTRQIANTLIQSSVYGFAGCRTSLIPHQLYIAHEVARRYAPRVLLADEVGLGKTIEAGLIMHQLLLTERANRILIVVPENLLHQWLVEMLRRFNLVFSVFDEERCEAMLNPDDDSLSDTDNPFHSEQLIICSLDFLVANPTRAAEAFEGAWDLLVVDEAHHLTWSAESVSPEYQTVETLARKTPGVLLLSATPEQLGKESHFARLRLLDPDRFSDLGSFLLEESNYVELADLVDALQLDSALDQDQLRLLEQTVDEGDNRRWFDLLDDQDSPKRLHARQQLIEHLLDRHGTGRVLFRNTRNAIQGFPERELHAYPLDPPKSWQPYLRSLGKQPDSGTQLLLSPELGLRSEEALTSWPGIDPRVKWLEAFLLEHKNIKILVIAAAADTVVVLAAQIKRNTGINVGVFHQGMSLIDRDRAAAWFADQDAGTQVLICSEIGSEGRNFQFAHHLVLFDLPANPDLLEQRIGRLDRIGQQSKINIHVPYLRETAQEVMFRWFHQGLNAFEKTCPAGHQVYMQLHHDLQSHLAEPALSADAFIERSNQLYLDLNEALKKGRDRLLEINSCHPLVADDLVEQAKQRDYDLDIFQYMEKIYDCFGVDSDIRAPDCWVISPGDNMLMKMPGLPDDGMTVTYHRNIALSNEDLRFLTWEHPFVRNAMDLILSSEFGNTALIAIKFPSVEPGTLLLDCRFLMEFSHDNTIDSTRYFPNSSVRVVIDEFRCDHQAKLDDDSIRHMYQRVDVDTSLKVVNAKESEISTILEQAELIADEQVAALVSAARQRGRDVLGRELERLIALQQTNPNVRDEEINFFRNQITGFEASLANARLRLDAVRVMIAV